MSKLVHWPGRLVLASVPHHKFLASPDLERSLTKTKKELRQSLSTIELYPTLFLSNKSISYIAFYIGPIQTGFLMMFQKSYGGTGIVIPVKKSPQERKKQESGGFLQELPT
jgi:hypothetical protein